MIHATLPSVIKECIRRLRETRVRQLDKVIEQCSTRLAQIDEDEEPELASRLSVRRQQAAFKRVNHLSKLDKE